MRPKQLLFVQSPQEMYLELAMSDHHYDETIVASPICLLLVVTR